MTTLRENIQAEIATIEAELAAKKASLVELETTAASVLNADVAEVKGFLSSLWLHITGTTSPAPAPIEPVLDVVTPPIEP
jgi:hypothetical protein